MKQEKVILSRVTTSQGKLQLQQCVDTDSTEQPVYEIIFNGVFLMASYNERSAKAVGTLAVQPLASKRQGIRVLVGGLGIGYTLQTVLDFDGVQAVDVVEIEKHIIGWAKSYFSKLNGHALSDLRVHLIQTDLVDYILKTEETYDVIILDVDNGPTRLALESNQRLYEEPTLARIRDLLTDGGILTVWAAEKCPAFQTRLEKVFDQTEVITVQEMDRRGHPTDYFIYRTR